jgi:hypothetical protein
MGLNRSMKMISKRTFSTVAGTLALMGFTGSSCAQTASVCPTDGIPPNNSRPRMIFPVVPVAGQPWQACYQNPAPCEFVYTQIPFTPNPSPHLTITATANGFDLNTQWLRAPFGICPDTGYQTANMSAVGQAGPITIRLFQRSASSVENFPFFPFVQTFEQVIQVRAQGVSSFAVPALDWRASLALCGLLIGVAASRRR